MLCSCCICARDGIPPRMFFRPFTFLIPCWKRLNCCRRAFTSSIEQPEPREIRSRLESFMILPMSKESSSANTRQRKKQMQANEVHTH